MVPLKSKNQQWKESGSHLSFKDWLRQDINNSVHKTLSVVGTVGYSNIDGGDTAYIAASNNYKPYTTGSVLGVNKYIIIGGVAIAVIAVGYAIFNKNKKGK